jgi:SAM-dependent methyltransferase
MTTLVSHMRADPGFTDPNLWNQLETCPLCGQRNFRAVFLATDRHYGNHGQFPIVECRNCGLNFLNPSPTMTYLSQAYPTDYYAYQPLGPSKSLWRLRLKKSLRRILFYNSHRTGEPKFKKPGTMLDIGCGSGTFLAEMCGQGWKVHGVELDSHAAQTGQLAGIDIFGGTIDAARYPSATFDYIRSNHSFEHLHNPREVLREIRRILKPSGRLLIGVPNVSGGMAQIWGTYWWYLGAPVHPFGYNPDTLSRLLREEGFVVEKVAYNSNFSGIFGSLQLYRNRNNGRLGEDGWIARSRLLMVLGYWIARVFDFFRRGDCIEVTSRPVEGSR